MASHATPRMRHWRHGASDDPGRAGAPGAAPRSAPHASRSRPGVRSSWPNGSTTHQRPPGARRRCWPTCRRCSPTGWARSRDSLPARPTRFPLAGSATIPSASRSSVEIGRYRLRAVCPDRNWRRALGRSGVGPVAGRAGKTRPSPDTWRDDDRGDRRAAVIGHLEEHAPPARARSLGEPPGGQAEADRLRARITSEGAVLHGLRGRCGAATRTTCGKYQYQLAIPASCRWRVLSST